MGEWYLKAYNILWRLSMKRLWQSERDRDVDPEKSITGAMFSEKVWRTLEHAERFYEKTCPSIYR